MTKNPKSITRLQYRDMENKIQPAIRAISIAFSKTGKLTDDFRGYEVPAGEPFADTMGRKWQLQVRMVVAKGEFIKKNEVKPMIKKWAIGLRLRVLAKYVIEWSKK